MLVLGAEVSQIRNQATLRIVKDGIFPVVGEKSVGVYLIVAVSEDADTTLVLRSHAAAIVDSLSVTFEAKNESREFVGVDRINGVWFPAVRGFVK